VMMLLVFVFFLFSHFFFWVVHSWGVWYLHDINKFL
jgi:hypothetical protein